MKILVIEDECSLREDIINYFSTEEHICESASEYMDAEDKLLLYNYDVVVLDITLPGGSGLDLLRTLKKDKPHQAVVIISAKNSLNDKIDGLNIGADDYITKPFHLSELNARIQAVIRRNQRNGSDLIKVNDVTIDFNSRCAFIDGKEIEFTKKEFEVFYYLCVSKNKVLTKQAIAEHLWGDNYDMADDYRFVYVHINNIKKKIKAAGGANHIKSIYGLGYKYESK